MPPCCCCCLDRVSKFPYCGWLRFLSDATKVLFAKLQGFPVLCSLVEQHQHVDTVLISCLLALSNLTSQAGSCVCLSSRVVVSISSARLRVPRTCAVSPSHSNLLLCLHSVQQASICGGWGARHPDASSSAPLRECPCCGDMAESHDEYEFRWFASSFEHLPLGDGPSLTLQWCALFPDAATTEVARRAFIEEGGISAVLSCLDSHLNNQGICNLAIWALHSGSFDGLWDVTALSLPLYPL